ncbi:hypothetical protein [uncultured Oscillibacter sp.]|uniref:hypothetical protein n=1 Tax=uncultured Oscillibacter sp. TaxID=876091 RepID=UPI0026361022|nr:hypothetical protein [uncultured Oscillibacter sp.]
MKTNVTGIPALALALCLLLAACGGQGASPSEAPPEDLPPEETAPVPSGFPELEETEWEAVSIDAEDYGIVQDPIGDPAVYGGAASLSLGKLIACSLSSDGAAAENLSDELRKRFLEAPHTLLAYLVLMGDQRMDYWDQPLASEVICRHIASADAAWYEGSEEFARTLSSCRERYPSGRIAELLDVMEQEHAASMERNHGQSE